MISIRQSVFSQLSGVFRGFSMPGAALTALLCLPLLAGPMSAAQALDDDDESDVTPRVRFERTVFYTHEGQTETITVIKDGEGEATVNYASSDHKSTGGPAHDATANVDYVPVSGELVFGSEDRTKTITVQSTADQELDEEVEGFVIKLWLPPDEEIAELGQPRTALVQIMNQK